MGNKGEIKMEKQTLRIRCAKCGDEFLYLWSGRGPKAKFCTGCLKERQRLSMRKYNRRKKAKKDKINKSDNYTKREWSYNAVKHLYNNKIISGWRYKRLIKKIERMFK